MNKDVNYAIVKDEPGQPLVIRDIGPWDRYLSVTNGAEIAVKKLYDSGELKGDRKLLYYDSSDELDELCHDGQGNFTRFAPGPR